MNRLEGKVLVAQGGGPTAVINQTLVGVTLEARRNPRTRAVYGALYGVRGIVEQDFVDLTRETTHNLEKVALTSSSALFSTRDKPDAEYCQRIFKVMQKHDIRYFFYIGGNDSADTVRIIDEQAKATGYDLRAVHVPKTIDNDLPVNDHCPGYGSAAKFVAQAFMGLNLDSRALPGVLIGTVMGRHSGFLTAASILAKKYADDGPHLIYLPERPFSLETFLTDVERVYREQGRCVIAVAEGIKDLNGTPIALQLSPDHEQDAHGNLQLSGTGILGDLLAKTIRDHLKIKRVRSDTFGYLQRCFNGVVSDRDLHEARELGEIAVHYAMRDNLGGSVVIRRPVLDYSVNYDLASLAEVAGKTRTMPDAFINAEGNGVTSQFRAYCRPLVGSQLPESFRLCAPRVPKIPIEP
jgi:ATP-dependent phosphofructokinase / diphosphate-dependent phosphofructokinase